MKPDNVHSVLLIGSSQIEASILFQCAVYFAEQGEKVLYISSSEIKALPTSIHGVPPPSSSSLSHIRFMYLPKWQDLFQHLYSLHQHAHIPNIVLVDGLHHYCYIEDGKGQLKMHAALVCASLLDSMSVCVKYTHKPAVFIASLQADPNLCPILDTFFSDSMWLTDSFDEDGIVALTKVTYPEQQNTTKMEFNLRNKDGVLVLNKILQVLNYHTKPTAIDKI
ncbi:hypothetical protein C0J52_16877 [Blattella germanica]|nr:hypothetical protein C0J52_16877 [Blattella germanica]